MLGSQGSHAGVTGVTGWGPMGHRMESEGSQGSQAGVSGVTG